MGSIKYTFVYTGCVRSVIYNDDRAIKGPIIINERTFVTSAKSKKQAISQIKFQARNRLGLAKFSPLWIDETKVIQRGAEK